MADSTFSSSLYLRQPDLTKRAQPGSVACLKSNWITTAPYRPADRLAFWADYVSAHAHSVVMPSTPTHDYRATALISERADIVITQTISDPLGFQRTAAHTDRAPSDRVRISYFPVVDGGIESSGRSDELSNGAVCFQDCRRPSSFWTHGALKEIFLLVPREWFVDSGWCLNDIDGIVFQAGHALARLLAQQIQTIASHGPGRADAIYARAVLDLHRGIGEVFAALQSASTQRKLLEKAALLRRIKAHIRRHAGECEHTPNEVADTLGLSRSKLYRLLREEGVQVAAYAAEYRLMASARMLRDPAWVDRQVGEIAARWGHHDRAYFARAFKERFDVTPSQWLLQIPTQIPRRAHE